MERPRNHYFFMHIPKTAGTSLRTILESRFEPERIIPSKREMDLNWKGHYPPIPWLLELPQERWDASQLLRGHYHYQVADRFPKSPRCLTMLREPVARSISALRHFSRHSPRFKGMTIAEMLANERLIRHQVANLQVRMLAARYSLNPERCPKNVAFSLKITRHEIELAQVTLRRFAFFGLREEFDKSIGLLFSVFGWSGSPAAPQTNVATGAAPDRFDPDLLAGLRDWNRADIELYEFARSLFWKRYRRSVGEPPAEATRPKIA